MTESIGGVEDLVPDDAVDATSRFEIYQTGKTITCDCGQGIGVTLKTLSVKCATCGVVLIDKKHGEREPKEDDGETQQASLGDWS